MWIFRVLNAFPVLPCTQKPPCLLSWINSGHQVALRYLLRVQY